MATAGSIGVNLTVESTSFISNMRKASESVTSFSETAKHGLETAKVALEAFAVIEVGEKLKEGLDKAIEYGAGLNALADKAGLTVESFQKFRFAAGEAGVSGDAFQNSMQRLTRSIGDAEAGSKKALAAFKEIGVSAEEIKSLTPEEALKKMIEALGKVPDPAKRAHLEVALLGRAGQELDPLIRKGAEGAAEMADTAARLGLTLSAGQSDKLHDLANAGHAIGEAFDAALAKGFADDAEALTKLAQSAAHAVAQLEKLFVLKKGLDQIRDRDGFGSGVITSLNDAYRAGTPDGEIALDRKRIADRQAAYDRSQGAFGQTTKRDVDKARGYLTADIISNVGGLRPLPPPPAKTVADDDDEKTAKATKAASAYKAELDRLNKSSAELALRSKLVGENLPTEEIALLVKRSDEYAEAEKKGDSPEHIAILKSKADENYKNAEALRVATKAQQDANAASEDFAERAKRLYGDADKFVIKTLADIAKVDYGIGAAADARTKAAADKIRHGFLSPAELQTGQEFFRDLSSGIGEVATGAAKIGDVLVQSFERAGAALIASKIFSLIGSIGIGGDNTIGSLFNFGGPRAAGGPTYAGRTYLVGENGPELRTDLGNGQIIPNSALKAMNDNGGGLVEHKVTFEPSPLLYAGVATIVQSGNAQLVDRLRKSQRTVIARGRS